jgi:TolB-like protein
MYFKSFVSSGASLLAVLSGITGAFAAAQTPATMPSARSIPRVEVFAFSAVSGAAPGDWNGRGIQEQLQSDVSRTGATLVLPPQAAVANADPIASARQNHADLAVTGSYQVVGDQIRANGHLIDVATNNAVGGFTATGSKQDLFKVEDALGEQLRALLPAPLTSAEISRAFEQPQSQVATAAAPEFYEAPSPTYVQPPTVNNYYDSSPDSGYYYPDYDSGYDYPYALGFYGGVGFGYGYRGYDRGGYYNHGFDGHRSFSTNPGFHSPAFRGGVGIGRSSGGFGAAGMHGGGFGGVHGGGGGRR